MKWASGAGVKWLLVGLGLATTSCAGAIGAGAAAVVVGAGVLAMTCYDRVAVTVVDQATGNQLCDARVTFWEGSSKTEATSCYTAALTTGKYTLKVERPGLVPYAVPVEVSTGSKCLHAVQTIYVAMERAGAQRGPQQVSPPAVPAAPAAPSAPAPAATPPVATPPAATPPVATPPDSATPPTPGDAPAPAPSSGSIPATPSPASTAFPDP